MEKTKLPSIVAILILTLVTSIVWVSTTVYHALTAKPPVSVPQEISRPLNPTLNQDAINKIESGTFFDNSQIPQYISTASSSPNPILTTVPQSTPVASPSASPNAP